MCQELSEYLAYGFSDLSSQNLVFQQRLYKLSLIYSHSVFLLFVVHNLRQTPGGAEAVGSVLQDIGTMELLMF